MTDIKGDTNDMSDVSDTKGDVTDTRMFCCVGGSFPAPVSRCAPRFVVSIYFFCFPVFYDVMML